MQARFLTLALAAIAAFSSPLFADDKEDLTQKLEAAKRKAVAEAEKTVLRYKFAAGEKVRWTTEHLASTETTIRGNTQDSQSRSVSTKLWTIKEVAEDGAITIENSVEEVEMWQEVSGRPETRYNSRTDKTPPPGHERVAETIGVPLATVKIDPHGAVIEREGAEGARSFGLGDFTLPLPEKAVGVGDSGNAPSEVMVRLPDGVVKRIPLRKVYTIKSMSAGVATIAVRTQVLAPVDDAQVQSQLVQQMTQGEIKFDVDAGRVIGSQIDWDESVIGFSGAGSVMKYLARYTEQINKPATATAKKP